MAQGSSSQSTSPNEITDHDAIASPHDSQSSEDKAVRIVFLGSGRTGKTSIVKRFLYGEHSNSYRATVEDIYGCNYVINGKFYLRTEFMDTSGSYNFPAMRRICISKASAFVLVFDIGDSFSSKAVQTLWNEIREIRDDYKCIPLVMAGNKCDLLDLDKIQAMKRMFEDEFLKKEELMHSFVVCSAKYGKGIFDIFHRLWNQNEKTKKIDVKTVPVSSKRRFSAFDASMPYDNALRNSLLTASDVPLYFSNQSQHLTFNSCIYSSRKWLRKSDCANNKPAVVSSLERTRSTKGRSSSPKYCSSAAANSSHVNNCRGGRDPSNELVKLDCVIS